MRSHLYCLLTICLFSTLEVSSKLLAGRISPQTIASWRFLIGGMVILPAALKQVATQKINFTIGSILKTGALGILNVCISMLLLQWSVAWGKASLSAIIISVNPIFVSMFAYLILKERLSLITWLGMLVGLAGLLMIIWGEHTHWMESQNLILGIGLACAASVCFALYTVLAKRLVSQYGNLTINSLSFLIGSVVLMLIYASQGKSVSFELTTVNILGLAWLGIFVSGLAYIMYFEGMKTLKASTASMYFFLKPVIASLLAWGFNHERLSFIQVSGIGVILASQVISRQPALLRRAFLHKTRG